MLSCHLCTLFLVDLNTAEGSQLCDLTRCCDKIFRCSNLKKKRQHRILQHSYMTKCTMKLRRVEKRWKRRRSWTNVIERCEACMQSCQRAASLAVCSCSSSFLLFLSVSLLTFYSRDLFLSSRFSSFLVLFALFPKLFILTVACFAVQPKYMQQLLKAADHRKHEDALYLERKYLKEAQEVMTIFVFCFVCGLKG